MRRTVPASRAGRSGSLRPPAAFPPVLHVTRSARSVRPGSCLRGGIRDEPTRPAAGAAVWVSGRRRERAAGADRERARGCAQAGAGPGTRCGPSREAQPGRQCLPISEMLAGTRGGRGLLGRATRLRTTRQGRAGPSAGPSRATGARAAGLHKGTRTRGVRSCRGPRTRRAEGPGRPGEKPGPQGRPGDSGVQRCGTSVPGPGSGCSPPPRHAFRLKARAGSRLSGGG